MGWDLFLLLTIIFLNRQLHHIQLPVIIITSNNTRHPDLEFSSYSGCLLQETVLHGPLPLLPQQRQPVMDHFLSLDLLLETNTHKLGITLILITIIISRHLLHLPLLLRHHLTFPNHRRIVIIPITLFQQRLQQCPCLPRNPLLPLSNNITNEREITQRPETEEEILVVSYLTICFLCVCVHFSVVSQSSPLERTFLNTRTFWSVYFSEFLSREKRTFLTTTHFVYLFFVYTYLFEVCKCPIVSRKCLSWKGERIARLNWSFKKRKGDNLEHWGRLPFSFFHSLSIVQLSCHVTHEAVNMGFMNGETITHRRGSLSLSSSLSSVELFRQEERERALWLTDRHHTTPRLKLYRETRGENTLLLIYYHRKKVVFSVVAFLSLSVKLKIVPSSSFQQATTTTINWLFLISWEKEAFKWPPTRERGVERREGWLTCLFLSLSISQVSC